MQSFMRMCGSLPQLIKTTHWNMLANINVCKYECLRTGTCLFAVADGFRHHANFKSPHGVSSLRLTAYTPHHATHQKLGQTGGYPRSDCDECYGQHACSHPCSLRLTTCACMCDRCKPPSHMNHVSPFVAEYRAKEVQGCVPAADMRGRRVLQLLTCDTRGIDPELLQVVLLLRIVLSPDIGLVSRSDVFCSEQFVDAVRSAWV